MAVIPRDRLVSRLRAHQMVPAGVPVRLDYKRGHPGWTALHAVTGEPLGVASEHTISEMALTPAWNQDTRPDGTVLLSPGSGEVTP